MMRSNKENCGCQESGRETRRRRCKFCYASEKTRSGEDDGIKWHREKNGRRDKRRRRNVEVEMEAWWYAACRGEAAAWGKTGFPAVFFYSG